MNQFRTTVLILLATLAAITLVVATTPVVQSMANTKSVQLTQKQSKFEGAIKVVLLHEGYISDHPSDTGGLTKWGLSLRFLQLESLDVDGDGDVDRDDVRAITKEKMYHIYFEKFWERFQYEKIESSLLATKLLDIAVNAGGSRAHKILKKAINLALNEDMTVDGNLDKATISIVNAIEPVVLLDAIRIEQADFYRALVKKTPAYSVFLKGWEKRAKW